MVSAFVDPKGGKVVVAVNLLDEDLVVELDISNPLKSPDLMWRIKIEARSVLTLVCH
jgi:hypothetical protein